MSRHLSVLLCLSAIQLSLGDPPVTEKIVSAKHVPLLGGWFEKSPEAEEVKVAARYAVQNFNTRSKGKRNFKLISITSAKTQVTSMINYKIDAMLGKTKCLKSEAHNLDTCALGRKRLACQFEVRFNPRNSKHELTNHTCKKVPAPSPPTTPSPSAAP